jgi:hypothetical protein
MTYARKDRTVYTKLEIVTLVWQVCLVEQNGAFAIDQFHFENVKQR